MLKEMGWETAVAAKNDYENPADCIIPFCDEYFDIPFDRSPFGKGNLQAFKMLKKIIDNGNYNVIHCHTPVGGALARLAACSARKNGTKVFYTAHGFHFFKGGPVKDWFFYYPVEKFLSRFTDVLFTINHEDYDRSLHFHAKQNVLLPGIGIDTAKFKNTVVDREKKRAEVGVPADTFLVISVGEVNTNKNHEVVIKALDILKNPDIHYIIAGRGEKLEYLKSLAKELRLENNVHFLGYRNDVNELYKIADMFAFMSKREGLPVALMEAEASGLVAVCSDIRGNNDIVTDGVNGYHADDDPQSVAININKAMSNKCQLIPALDEKFEITVPMEIVKRYYES